MVQFLVDLPVCDLLKFQKYRLNIVLVQKEGKNLVVPRRTLSV